ncbi:hypothetical protein EVG20_g1068 [Dentipellis fragilis]|uniref:Phosphoglycerate mutase-like protein n=1 Tax=Dentipellis fragilis TaxID=205917 RepID=A0A4Y9ZCQ7_9AGAM|nr:hypothetical protein EVG20_g1068 [Dentipellis fragilis]
MVRNLTDHQTSPTALPRDPPLAAFGETQANEVAEYFLSLPEDERPTAIYSSPYYRCLQTSKPASAALGVPIYVEHGLSEWYSPVEPGTGLHPRPSSAANLRNHISEIDDSWSSMWYPSRKGEDVDAVHDRAGGFLEAFVPEVEQRFERKHKRVLLVSHAATVIAITRESVGDRDLPIRVPCCSLTILKRKPLAETVRGGWDALLLADGSHLKEGSQRDWGFDDTQIANGKVINDHGVPGTEGEEDHPVGNQLLGQASRM